MAGFSATSIINRDAGISSTPETWADNYKDAFIQKHHDSTQMDVVLPDDCLVVSGPPRLLDDSIAATLGGIDTSVPGSGGFFMPIGFITSLSITEARQVQPMKGLGSYRHVFTATNTPVQLQVERMMIEGPNLLRCLYYNCTEGINFYNKRFQEGNWYMNLEDDIYRIPFGLGICYTNPRALSRTATEGNYLGAPGADYFEGCVIQSCSMSIQQGQTVIMENVSMYADRRVPFVGYFNKKSTYGANT